MHTLTDHSRTTHGVLSEPSHREGKGREGKWNGKGGRVETSHHSVALVTRESAAGVVAGPVDEMMTGLSIIEGIDLDAEIPCEVTCKVGHSLDPHPADVLSRFVCRQCGHVRVKARCWPIVRATESGRIRVYCTACGDFPAEPDLTTIEVLR